MKGRGGNPARLPSKGALTIPWITRREGEEPPATLEVGWATTDHGPALVSVGPDLERDRYGWLWAPAPECPDGAPQFSQVHPIRQRRAMDELRCQVCGQRTTLEKANWLVPEGRVGGPDWLEAALAKGAVDTEHAPLCARCLGISRAQCPHLRRHGGYVLLRAEAVEVIAVLADIYSPVSSFQQRRVPALLYPDSKYRARAIARQRVVRLYGAVRLEAS